MCLGNTKTVPKSEGGGGGIVSPGAGFFVVMPGNEGHCGGPGSLTADSLAQRSCKTNGATEAVLLIQPFH